jgi:hypothetical protein
VAASSLWCDLFSCPQRAASRNIRLHHIDRAFCAGVRAYQHCTRLYAANWNATEVDALQQVLNDVMEMEGRGQEFNLKDVVTKFRKSSFS